MSSKIDWVNNHPSPQIACILAGIPLANKRSLFAASWLCNSDKSEPIEVLRRYRVLNWVLFSYACLRLEKLAQTTTNVDPVDPQTTVAFANNLYCIPLIRDRDSVVYARDQLSTLYWDSYQHYGDSNLRSPLQERRTALAQAIREVLANAYFCTFDVAVLCKAVAYRRIATFFPESGPAPEKMLQLVEELCAIKV